MPSKKAAAANGNTFRRLKVRLDDGRELTLLELRWNELSPHVARLYRNLRTLEPSGRKDRDGNPAHVKDSTANRELTVLQAMLTYHRDERRSIPYNPLDDFERINEEGNARQTALTPEQMETFLAHAHPMYQDVVRVAYRCMGLRKGEAQRLRKTEVDWEARTIHLPADRNKNRRARHIPFPEDVARILQRHSDVSRGPYVFVDPKDPQRLRPVHDSAMWYWLNQARKRSGMTGFDGEPIVTHTVRHSAATTAVESGIPERYIRATMGMTAKTLDRYAKFGRKGQDIVRDYLNRTSEDPTPITAELEGERHPATPAAAGPGRLRRVDTD